MTSILDHAIEVVHHDTWAVATSPTGGFIRLTTEEATALNGPLESLPPGLVADLEHAGLLGGMTLPPKRIRFTRSGIEVNGADRILQLMYQHGLKRVFDSWVLILLSVIGVSGSLALGVQLLASQPLATTTLDPIVAALAILSLGLCSMVIHEIAHGLVLAHNRRHIRRVGIGCYWGMPTAYVDASEALLLPRRARITQALAGPFADFVVAGICSLAAFAINDSTTGSVLRLAAITIWLDIALNAAPLLELDGYWALADLLNRPQLRAESSAAAWQFLRHPLRGRSRLALYGVASSIFGVTLLLIALAGWWALVGDLVNTLTGDGITGWLLIAPLAMPTVAAWIGMLAQVVHLAARAWLPARTRAGTSQATDGHNTATLKGT